MLIEADLGPNAAAKIAEAFGEQRFGRQSTSARSRRRWPRPSPPS